MVKGGKDRAEKARRRVTRMRRKLRVAQEEHEQERVRGQQQIERTRLLAGKRLAKIAQRIDRLAESLTQAEADLQRASRGGPKKSKRDRVSKQDAPAAQLATSSPSAAADAVQGIQDAQISPDGDSALIVPEAAKRELAKDSRAS
jgi:hypothetical protein